MRDIRYQEPPGVLIWQKAYCSLMTLLGVAFATGGLLLLIYADALAGGAWRRRDAYPLLVMGGILVVTCAPLAILYGAALFLPRRPWVWSYNLALIGLGLSSPCYWPATVPLLFFWIRPETRDYFDPAESAKPPPEYDDDEDEDGAEPE